MSFQKSSSIFNMQCSEGGETLCQIRHLGEVDIPYVSGIKNFVQLEWMVSPCLGEMFLQRVTICQEGQRDSFPGWDGRLRIASLSFSDSWLCFSS